MKHAIVLLVLAMFNCSHAEMNVLKSGVPRLLCLPPVNFAFSNRFPVKHISSIRSGFEYWNKATGLNLFKYSGQINLNSQNQIHKGFVIIDTPTRKEKVSCGRASFNSGYIFNGKCALGAIVLLNPICMNKSSPERVETLGRHEAGHVLGLTHSDYQMDPMWPEIQIDEKAFPHPRNAETEVLQLLRKIYVDKNGALLKYHQ